MKYRAYFLAAIACLVVCFSAYAVETDDAYYTGEVKDRVYVNRALGAEAYFDDNWRILSKKEIAQVMGLAAASSPSLEEIAKGNMPVFLVGAKDGTANINIVIVKLGAQIAELLMNAEIDSVFMDMYMGGATQGVSKTYTEMGVNDFTVERMKTNFLGSEHPGVFSTAKIHELITQYQKQVVCFSGEYAITLTATSIGTDKTDDMLAMFRKIGN